MKKITYLLIAFLATTGMACTKTEEVVCSEEFRLITVGVTDAQGAPVLGATTYTIRQSDGDTIKIGFNQPNNGNYIVLTDNQKLLVKQEGEKFKFVVSKGTKSVSGVYKIQTDFCHIEYVSGPDNLILR